MSKSKDQGYLTLDPKDIQIWSPLLSDSGVQEYLRVDPNGFTDFRT